MNTYRSPFAAEILGIADDLDPDAVHAHICVAHDAVGSLTRDTLMHEVTLARLCEQNQPGYLAKVKRSFWGKYGVDPKTTDRLRESGFLGG